ncbi:hypothetical protein JVU11DRAFT_7447 [Chiua virens]|nr:hypothetical protein JVU11DRAFT_7447 [Chiua virens]
MVQLRSATKRVASEQENIDADDNGATVESSPESDYEPPVKKRRRTGVAARKQKARKHRGLSQLCIDELYIVFAFVYPMDLLNLARTCKYLRSFLMYKSSQFLWKDALGRVENLPDCPADLTEPQYTNLVFYNRCHICDKPATTAMWNLRRRYCSACRTQRLCDFCTTAWSTREALPYDTVTMGKNGSGVYVDKDQLDLFMHEYDSSTDKEQFLEERRKSRRIIHMHAYSCLEWQRGQGRVKRFDLEILRKERQTSIFERLKKHGYGPEIEYFGCRAIQDSYKSAFKQHTHLADSEWEQMWPKWVDIMHEYRLRRLDTTCYYARRKLLGSEYDKYVRVQTPGTPIFDLLPHVADLATFPPFRNIIEAPEDTQISEEPFALAFAQLPVLVDEWKQQLDVGLAELVKIPPHLTWQDTSSRQVVESNNAESDESNLKNLAKLHLACAVFRCRGSDLFTHREVFFAAMRFHTYPPVRGYVGNQTGANTIQERFNISFLEEIPYIVHTCGLDPNVATADDMDRRNARLTCLACSNSPNIIMDWRDAMLHANQRHAHNSALVPLSESPRWQVISNDHIEAIQAIETSAEDRFQNGFRRCLLCRPRMGDGLREEFVYHMQSCHGLDMMNLEESVHYACLGLEGHSLPNRVEMVEEGGQMIFRRLQHR